jgi:hypothetical protein
MLAASCGGSDLEVIHAVPAHVITVDELVYRVRRSYYEPTVTVDGLRVVGVIVRRPFACDPEKGPWTCPKGLDARFLFADDAGSEPVALEILGEGDKVEVGKRYVFWGSAEMANDVPQRWVLRARVLARVEGLGGPEAPTEDADMAPSQPNGQQPYPQPQPVQPQPSQPYPQPLQPQPMPQPTQPQPMPPQPQPMPPG